MSQLNRLAFIVDELATISVDANTEQELATLAALARAGSRHLEGLVVRIASRASALHGQGRSGSASEVLAGGGHVSTATAKREAKRAEIIESLPQLGSAMQAGAISGEHLDIVARSTNNLTDEQRAHLDTDALARAAKQTSPDEFARAARNLIDNAKQDWGLGRAIEERQKSEFKTWRDRSTGMGRISGWLDPERYSSLLQQLNAETASLAASRASDGETVARDEFLAIDAFVSLMEKGTGSLGRPTLIVHVDADTAINGPHKDSLRETDDGHQIPPESLQRFLCDSVVQPVVTSRGLALKVGRKTRTATSAQWAALRAMYAACAWHGCTTQIDWCQAHHVVFWRPASGSRSTGNGRTDLGNLVPLCSHHHHRVHEGHWQLHLAPDRTLTIKTPSGTTWNTTAPGRQPLSNHGPSRLADMGVPGGDPG